MNPHTPPPPDDDALAREERELAALYRRLPQAEPDAALDAAVLAQASRAVESRRRHALPRWAVALSSAAVLVLAAGLVWRLEFAQQQIAPMEAPAVLQQAKPDAAATRDMAPASAEPVPAPGRASQPAMARRVPAAAPHSPEPQVREERGRQAPAIIPQVQGLTAAPAKVLAAPPAKRAANTPPRIAPPPPVDEASTMALPPPPAPAPPAPPAPAPSKPSMVVLQEHPAAITTVFAADMAKDGTTATASTVAAPGEAATVPPAFAKRVEQIRQALRQGASRDETRKAVQALQREFPDVALPDDLRAFGNKERP